MFRFGSRIAWFFIAESMRRPRTGGVKRYFRSGEYLLAWSASALDEVLHIVRNEATGIPVHGHPASHGMAFVEDDVGPQAPVANGLRRRDDCNAVADARKGQQCFRYCG